jgi:glycerol kinase
LATEPTGNIDNIRIHSEIVEKHFVRERLVSAYPVDTRSNMKDHLRPVLVENNLSCGQVAKIAIAAPQTEHIVALSGKTGYQ